MRSRAAVRSSEIKILAEEGDDVTTVSRPILSSRRRIERFLQICTSRRESSRVVAAVLYVVLYVVSTNDSRYSLDAILTRFLRVTRHLCASVRASSSFTASQRRG